MPLISQRPLLYLITSGKTTDQTTSAAESFTRILQLVQAAVAARIDLVQVREKHLRASVLYELSASAAAIIKGSATKLLINDRSDIAAAAGADGVHLTTRSLPAGVVRKTFGDDFLIGVSTHSLAEAEAARENGADFVVFGPVFHTAIKIKYGEPTGVAGLAKVTASLSPFPVFALGGLSIHNAASCIEAGAAGLAGIGMFENAARLVDFVKLSEPPA